MCGFYRKHVPSFAKIATLLNRLTRSRVTFQWTEECEQAFQRLKECLMNAQILARAQMNEPFLLTTDVSNTHVGGVLSQTQPDGTNRPVG